MSLTSDDQSSPDGCPPRPLSAAQAVEFESLDQQWRDKLQKIAWAVVRDWALAADAVQMAFLALHERWAEVLPEHRPGWLIKSVQYSAHNLRRSQASQRKLAERLADLPPQILRDHSAIEEEVLQKALRQLTANHQTVVRMRLVEDLTFQEIAQQLEIPLGTALSRMRLALEKIRSTLGARDEE